MIFRNISHRAPAQHRKVHLGKLVLQVCKQRGEQDEIPEVRQADAENPAGLLAATTQAVNMEDAIGCAQNLINCCGGCAAQ
jgi:hypothetical protein